MSDLVIVGGGIVGAATCLYGHLLGLRCTLIERDGIATHASGWAFGGLHPRVAAYDESPMPAFARASFAEHETLDQLLNENFAKSSTWRKTTSVALAFDEDEVAVMRESAAHDDVGSEWLDGNAVRQLEPQIAKDVQGGILSKSSAEVDAQALTKCLIECVRPTYIQREVVGVEAKGDRIVQVTLNDGSRIAGDAFVFAVGPWSAKAMRWLGIEIGVRPLKGQILRLRFDGPALRHSFSSGSNYMSSKRDGLLWVGTTEEETGFDASPTRAAAREIGSILERVIPSAAQAEIVKQTACLRPMSPDGAVIVGHVPGWRNAFIGTGGGRKGILYGPLMGKHIADLITGARSSALSPARFLHTSR